MFFVAVLALLFPIRLYSQAICTTFSDSTHTIVHSDTRSLFTSKDVFEQKLISTARSKLTQATKGIAIRQEVYLYQVGNRTVSTVAQIGTHQVSDAIFNKECYTITYKGRTATIILRADVASTDTFSIAEADRIPLPTVENTNVRFLGVTKRQWKKVVPYYLLYGAIIFL